MLGAAVGHAHAPTPDLRTGAPLPWLWHWAAFPEFVGHAELGRDGHPALGRFLPPLRFSRRMWAAGKLTFTGQLHIGEPLHRRSEIVSVTEKDGSTGPMAFVTVAHRIEGECGGLIEERQDIAYLDIPDRFRPPRQVAAQEAPDFDEAVIADEARLFRFSAATYNAHRIHYDLPYARDVEKYPALVVHGPMQAIMLIEAGLRHSGLAPARFAFRGLHPMFHDHGLRLTGKILGKGVKLETVAPGGYVGLQANMEGRT